MKIILSGGGSGGHITPILAVADELKRRQPQIQIIYIGQKGDKLSDVSSSHHNIDEVYTVRAGKFRRYHGQGWKQWLNLGTLFKNIRDGLFVLIGLWQSYWLLKKLHPDVIFVRGGFVGVPVGLAAARRKIPYITHESDSVLSLTNRIIAKWAAVYAVALPKEGYPYPAEKTFEVGIPISETYQKVTYQLQTQYRSGLGLKADERVICVTGGGLGAQRLNEAVCAAVPELLKKYPSLVVFHIAGRMHEAALNTYYDEHVLGEQRRQIIVKGFVNDLYRYTAAADLIVSRAGATNLAEFALQQKACIVVPNPMLAGGHQLKNAEQLAAAEAIRLVEESQLEQNPAALLSSITELLTFQEKRQSLAENLGKFAKPNATKELVDIIMQVAKQKGATQTS